MGMEKFEVGMIYGVLHRDDREEAIAMRRGMPRA